MDANNNILQRPIFGNFLPDNIKIIIGQLYDLRDESFLPSSVLKTELLPAIRVYDDEKCVKIEVFKRPFLAEFISALSNDLLTQLKAYANLGIFKTLTTDSRILSPNSDALISIKFTFRKKILKLRDIDANVLELVEKFIAKSQFAVTEIEMGQWIFVSVSSKNEMDSNLEPIQTFLESYFTGNPEISEIPSEASNFLYKFVTSESIYHQPSPEYISFKEFFESLKSIFEKHRCFPISVKLTSLLDLGLFTIDNRLETLQCSFDSHEFFLKFFHESEIVILKLQETLTSHLKIFTLMILKKLRQSEIYLAEIMEKFKATSIYDKQKLEVLQTEIENDRFVQSIETFIQNLESQFAAKQSNFIDLEVQKLLHLSPENVKFVLIIGENEKQKMDFINLLINISQCSTFDEALTYKMTTFLPYSNTSKRKSIVLTKNNQTSIFIAIKGMDYCNNILISQNESSTELAKILNINKQLNTVILLFSKSTPLRSFQKWIPKQLSKATKNFIYFNFYSKKPLKSQKWKDLSEILPTGSLYFLHQKILKQNFIQMPKPDLEMAIQNIHQILRKIGHFKSMDDIEEDTVMEFVKCIFDISKEVINKLLISSDNEGDGINVTDKIELDKVKSIFISNLANLCKFANDPNITNFFANIFFASSQDYLIWDTVIRLDSLSLKEIKNVCNEVFNLPILDQIFQQKLLENSKTDIITYECESKIGINFFNEKIAFSCKNDKVFEEF